MSTDKTLADALTRFRCAGYDPTDGSGPIMVADPDGPWVLATDVIGTGSDCEATPASPDAPESGGDWFGDVLGSIGTVIPLSDVQPGGRVRLGDAPWPEIDMILADAYSAGAEGLLDRYDAGLLGDGGGGDVTWWQDYIRTELDRAHEFYQDQADSQAVGK